MEWQNLTVITVSGFLGGLFGGQVGGGGLITLPVLLALGIPTTNAIAINRFSGVFINASAAYHYIREKKLQWKMLLWTASICVTGSMIGVYIVMNIEESLLKKILAFILILLLFVVGIRKNLGLTEKKYTPAKKHLFFLVPVLFCMGIYTGMISIAGTTFFALFFVLQGQSFSQSMGFACFIMAATCITTAFVFFLNSLIIWQYAIPQALAISVGGALGAKFAIQKGNRWIKYLFITVSAVFVLKLLYDIYVS